MIQLDHIDVTFQQKKRQINRQDAAIHINRSDNLWDWYSCDQEIGLEFQVINLLLVEPSLWMMWFIKIGDLKLPFRGVGDIGMIPTRQQ